LKPLKKEEAVWRSNDRKDLPLSWERGKAATTHICILRKHRRPGTEREKPVCSLEKRKKKKKGRGQHQKKKKKAGFDKTQGRAPLDVVQEKKKTEGQR